MTSSQEDVWRAVFPKVEKVLEGYNATIFTYGMTGSGKTFTMLGPRLMSVAWEERSPSFHEVCECEKRGIVPRTVQFIFERLRQANGENTASNFRVKMSYMQVYRERCYDLLQPATSAPPLKVREDPSSSSSTGVYVENLTEAPLQSVEDCLKKLLYGSSNIAFRSTAYNEQSSRSHVILTLIVEQTRSVKDGLVRQSKIHLVDLAGNERWEAFGQGPMSPGHARELTSINQSLHTLGNCIQALSQPAQISKRDSKPLQAHVPYRNSVLTMLLRDSLGGSSLTLMLCTISSCSLYQMQSLCTLRFGDRAKRVKMRAKINENVDSKMLLQQSQAEIAYLRRLVAEGGISGDLQKRLQELEGENQNLKETVQNLTAEHWQLRSSMAEAEEASEAPVVKTITEEQPALPVHSTSASSRAGRLRTNSEPALPAVSEWFDELDGATESSSSAAIVKSASVLVATADPAILRGALHRRAGVRASTLSAAADRPCKIAKSPQGSIQPHAGVASLGEVRDPGKDRTSPSGSQKAEEAHCPDGHVLTCLGSSKRPLGSASYVEWHCDAANCRHGSCGMPELIRHHCRECQYDLCEHCFRKQVTLKSQPAAFTVKDDTSAAQAVKKSEAGIFQPEAAARGDGSARTSRSLPPAAPSETWLRVNTTGDVMSARDRAVAQSRSRAVGSLARVTASPAEQASAAALGRAPLRCRALAASWLSDEGATAALGTSSSLRQVQPRLAALAADHAVGEELTRVPQPPQGQPPAKPRPAPRGQVRGGRGRSATGAKKSMPRSGSVKAVSSYTKSLSEKGTTLEDRERQLMLMEYYRLKFEEPEAASEVQVALMLQKRNRSQSNIQDTSPSWNLQKIQVDADKCEPQGRLQECNVGYDNETCSQQQHDVPDNLIARSAASAVELPSPCAKDCIKLPSISSTATPTSSAAGALEATSVGPEERETQRQPWRQQHSSEEFGVLTQRRFFAPSSPRNLEANLPPISPGSSSSSRSAKLSSSSSKPPPRSATGAPLSPLGTGTDAKWAPQDSNKRPSIPSAAAAKDLTALHSRLGISGLLASPTPPPTSPDTESKDSAPPTAAAPTPGQVPGQNLPQAFEIGAAAKGSSIGALLGELDSRRELESSDIATTGKMDLAARGYETTPPAC
jgi:hypothetical protein